MGYVFTDQYNTILVNDEETLNLPKNIRFITPDYKTKFIIPDGGHILIKTKSGEIKEYECKYLDEYHFHLDGNSYHICQFAELLEKGGSVVAPFEEKRIVWSNIQIDYDSWKASLKVDYPDLGNDDYDAMIDDLNSSYLENEREILDVSVGEDIIAICDIGRWNGRMLGCKAVNSSLISDCLYPMKDCEYYEWYVDRQGELRSEQRHHDGTNYILYRKWKKDVGDDDKSILFEKFCDGTVSREDIDRVTDKLGYDVGKVYGWMFPDKEYTEKDKNKNAR